MSTTNNTNAVIAKNNNAKANLLALINKEDVKATSDPIVQKAVEELHQTWISLSSNNNDLYKHRSDPMNCEYWRGQWIQISSPEYPDRIPTEDSSHRYTLGRLSFNIFEPCDMVCTLKGVKNIVEKVDEETDSYTLVQSLILHTEGGEELPASLVIEGLCCKSQKKDSRVSVTFGAGELRKGDEISKNSVMAKTWDATFKNIYSEADKRRSLTGRMSRSIIKFAFNMTMPEDFTEDVVMPVHRYEMKRSPRGYLDVLYLDEDLRITRGNRGTIVIVQRESKE